ncbi:MAG: hypothetical protein UE033_05850 [Coprococcus sp.]|jgi:hypothetical protein|nr:hypothetical protein [Coprococcus sp.]
MRIMLIDNAVDSLQIAMNAFNLWNKGIETRNNFRFLKITIEFLHNAMELLLKATLNLEDEKIIYSSKNDRQKDSIEKNKVEAEKQKISLIEYTVKNSNLKTLSYGEILKKCIEMGIVSGGRKIECLEKLGIYRNQIMHLGIDVNEDFAELLAVIHESFYLIIDDNFYSGLLEISDYFSYSDVLDTIEPWQELSGDTLRLLSTTIEKRKLEIFDKIIEAVLESDQFTNFINTNCIILKNKSIYQDNYIDLEFTHNRRKIELTTEYDAFYNYTTIVMVTYCYKIVFCVKHFENEMVIGKRWIEYDDFALESIHNKEDERYFLTKPLTEKNIRNCLLDTLKMTILCNNTEY